MTADGPRLKLPAGVAPGSPVAVAAAHAASVDLEGRHPAEAIAALREAGELGAMIPIRLGGRGQDLAATASFTQELSRVCASTAMIYAMHQIQVMCLLEHYGDNPWQEAFLRRVAAEELLLASATSEEGIGGRIRESRCAIEALPGNRFALAKEASTLSYGQYADAILATARRAPDTDASDQVLVVVPCTGDTLDPYRAWNGLGLRGTGSGAFRLRTEGDAAQILSTPFGTIAAATMLPVAHILWGAVWLGISADIVTRSRGFVRHRQPDGVRLNRLAEMVELLSGMDARLRRALTLFAAGQAVERGVEMSLLKTDLSETALEIAARGLRLTGFAGYCNDTPFSLGRQYRDLLSAPLMVSNDAILGNAGHLVLLSLPQVGQFSDEKATQP